MLKSYFVAFPLLFLFACATPPAVLEEATDERPQTTFLLNYELLNPAQPSWEDQCLITLQKLDSKTQYQAPLNLHKKMIHIVAPAGDYRIDRLTCKKGGNWPLDNFGAPHVRALSERVNYLGKFSFHVTKNKNTYELFENRGTREDTLNALRKSASSLGSEQKNRIVSAYNGKKIDLKTMGSKTINNYRIVSHITGHRTPPNALDFTACNATETKSNPVLVGDLSYEAFYENDSFKKMNLIKNSSSFSNTYLACIETALRDFKPGFSDKIRYDIQL